MELVGYEDNEAGNSIKIYIMDSSRGGINANGGINTYMIIVLLGASGSGKSTIENELATHHGFEKIILRNMEV